MLDEIVEFILDGFMHLVSAIIEDKPFWKRILIWVAVIAVLLVVAFMIDKVIGILKN